MKFENCINEVEENGNNWNKEQLLEIIIKRKKSPFNVGHTKFEKRVMCYCNLSIENFLELQTFAI